MNDNAGIRKDWEKTASAGGMLWGRLRWDFLSLALIVFALALVMVPNSAKAILDNVGQYSWKEYTVKPSETYYSDENWTVRLTNCTMDTPVQFNILGLFGIEPKFDASAHLTTTMDFEIEFKKANWEGGSIRSSIGMGTVEKKDSFLYHPAIDVALDDQILLLVTCVEKDSDRRIVAARRIRDGEEQQQLQETIQQSR